MKMNEFMLLMDNDNFILFVYNINTTKRLCVVCLFVIYKRIYNLHIKICASKLKQKQLILLIQQANII